jgi:hypothetical protein
MNVVQQWPDYLLAELPNTVHSCKRHGVVAARLTAERPGSVYTCFKNIFPVLSKFCMLC